jgi:putative endonuclease
MHGGWVYIVANKPHGVIYTGVTADLAERIAQHRSGRGGSRFAKKYNLGLLVYAEPHATMLEAIAREKAVKDGRACGACASSRRATRTGAISTKP